MTCAAACTELKYSFKTFWSEPADILKGMSVFFTHFSSSHSHPNCNKVMFVFFFFPLLRSPPLPTPPCMCVQVFRKASQSQTSKVPSNNPFVLFCADSGSKPVQLFKSQLLAAAYSSPWGSASLILPLALHFKWN